MRPKRQIGSILAVLFLLANAAHASDTQVTIQTVSPTYNGTEVVWGKGGRIGNWLNGSGNNVVMDANYATGLTGYDTNMGRPRQQGGVIVRAHVKHRQSLWFPKIL